MRSLKIKLEDLNKYIDKETVIDLIYKIVFLLLINERKGKGSFYLSKISKKFDSVEIIKIRKKKAISYKQ